MNISGLSASVTSTSYSPEARAQAKPSDTTAPATGKATDPIAAQDSKIRLSAAELEQIRQLKARDTQVRQHEQAHLAASGGLAISAPSYTYQKGPDGVSYAIGGEVSINLSAGRTPQETISRARTIEAAALAPADPSGQDRAVAAQARQMEQAARAQLAAQVSAEITAGYDHKQNVGKYYYAIDKADTLAGSINAYA